LKFSLYVDQPVAQAWGINLKAAHVFAVIYDASAWADRDETGEFWNVAKAKVVAEIPLVVSKVDTVYRIINDLRKAGVIDKRVVESKDFYRITPLGLQWNSSSRGQEVIGDTACNESGFSSSSAVVGEISEGRKNIRGSEKNPTEGVFVPAARKKIRDSSEKNPAVLGKKSDVLEYQNTITNISSCRSLAGEVLTADWVPPDEIVQFCQQSWLFTQDEYDFVLMDYRLFWLSDDGLRRDKPRSWGNNFKQRFSGALARRRADVARLDALPKGRRTRDMSIAEKLNDRSWAS